MRRTCKLFVLREHALVQQAEFADIDAQERDLENALFGRDEEALAQLGQEAAPRVEVGGSLADFLRSYASGHDAERDDAQLGDADLQLFEDRRGAGGNEAPPGHSEQADGGGKKGRRQAVWEDPQDARVRVNVAERSQLRKLRQAEDETELTGGCRHAHCLHACATACPAMSLRMLSCRGASVHAPLLCCAPPAANAAGQVYEQRLRQQHNKLNPRTSWASLKKAKRRQGGQGAASDDDAEEAAERLLQRAGGLLTRGSALPPTMLETTRLKDANQADPVKGAVK